MAADVTTEPHNPAYFSDLPPALQDSSGVGGESRRAFERLAGLAARLAGVSVVLVAAVDQDRLAVGAATGLSNPAAASRLLDLLSPLCERVIALRQPLGIDDTRQLSIGRRSGGEFGERGFLGIPLLTGNGRVLGVCCLIDRQPRSWTDAEVTALRDLAALAVAGVETESADHELERQLAAIVEFSDDAIIGRTVDGVIVSWNPGAERLFGYTADQVKGRSIAMLVPPDRAHELVEIAARLRRGERARFHETVRLRKDRRPVDVALNAFPIKDAGGRVTGAATIARDITESKRLTESKFRAFLESAPDAMVIVDGAGEIVLLNTQAEKLFSYRREELLGRPIEMLLPGHLRQAHAQHRAGYHRQPVARPMGIGLDLTGLRKDGTEFSAEISLSPLETEDGPQVIAAIRDLTERRRAEEARAQLFREQAARAQAEAAVRVRNEFLATVSHDLKNPLVSMKGYAQLLQRQVMRTTEPTAETMAKIAEGLAKIDSATGKMNALIAELLDLARLETGQPIELDRQHVDLVALARQVAGDQGLVTDRHRVRVESDVPELVGEWDPVRLERVLANLISNAIKYSPEGGEVRIELRREEDAAGARAVLAVHDHGLGIPAADLPHIFDRFHRAANVPAGVRGTGIGLASVRQVVEQHGGTVDVESREAAGSTFTVRLPLGR